MSKITEEERQAILADITSSRSDVGNKFDENKVRMDLLPWSEVRDVAEILTFGASKYGDRNWEQGIQVSRLFAATMRHLTAWWAREEIDIESGCNHLAHTACNILMILWTMKNKSAEKFDDRPGDID